MWPFYTFCALVASLMLSLSACRPEEPMRIRSGYRPLYMSADQAFKVEVLPARQVGTLGKIYIQDSLLLVNELNKGIHVYNNSNPDDPRPLFFLSIPGNRDIAMTDHYLYADNLTDLVVLDLSDFSQIREISRVKDLYPSSMFLYPEFATQAYFECADSRRGLVVEWLPTDSLINPRCATSDMWAD